MGEHYQSQLLLLAVSGSLVLTDPVNLLWPGIPGLLVYVYILTWLDLYRCASLSIVLFLDERRLQPKETRLYV